MFSAIEIVALLNHLFNAENVPAATQDQGLNFSGAGGTKRRKRPLK
jgi:hypothetical protein